MKRTVKLSVAAAGLIVLTSCSYATKEELAKVRTDAQESRRVATQALTEADSAKADANEAKLQAQQSTVVSQRTEETVNRSYKKSMYK